MEAIRLDKYLWAVRIFKTRSDAAEAIRQNRVLVNDAYAKPSREVRIGDRIWAGGVQSAEAGTDGNVADFGFTNLPGAAPYRIYYNMTGTDAEAVVPTEQRQAEPGKLQLGPNGDFGYATTDSEGRFTLSHATAYVWFNPWSQDVKEKLVSVTLAASHVIDASPSSLVIASQRIMLTPIFPLPVRSSPS